MDYNAELQKIDTLLSKQHYNAIRFRDMIEACLTDGHIDEDEKDHLRKKADQLHLDHIVANSIFLACIQDIVSVPLFDEK